MFAFKMKKPETISKELSDRGEEILKEAHRILSLKPHRELFTRIRERGFDNVVDIGNYEGSYDLSYLIIHCRQWYPQNNCLTERQIEEVCKKHKLLFGNVRDYTGNIPYKNLKDIDNFELRQDDIKGKLEFKIVAPHKLMDTRNREIRDGWRLENKDPVVFVKIERNWEKVWLQVTAWDKEAFLPEFQNPNSN